MRLLLAAVLTAALLSVAGSALAQPAPGTPLVSPPCFLVFNLREGPNEVFADEHIGPIVMDCLVAGGFVVLLERPEVAGQHDPHNWSDVVAFTEGGPPQPGQPTSVVWYVSDSEDPATGLDNGITPADLAAIGVTPIDIIANPTTVYILEGMNPLNPALNEYDVPIPGAVVQYRIFSDPPEGPTPAQRNTWGRIKALYR